MNAPAPPHPVSLTDLLDEWTRAGLISAPARAAALEGLGYFGAAIATAAAIRLSADHWADLGVAGRDRTGRPEADAARIRP